MFQQVKRNDRATLSNYLGTNLSRRIFRAIRCDPFIRAKSVLLLFTLVFFPIHIRQ